MLYSYIKESFNQITIKIDESYWTEEKSAYYGESKTIYKKNKVDTIVIKQENTDNRLSLSDYNFNYLRYFQNYFRNAKTTFQIIKKEKEIFSPYKTTNKKEEYIEIIKIEDNRNGFLVKADYSFEPDKINYKKLQEDFLRVKDRDKRSKKIVSGEYDLFFRKKAAGILIHEIIGHLLEADISLKSDTPFKKDKLNKKVLPEHITIYDDILPTDTIDDEGIKMEPVILIDRGVLKNFISDYNYYLAGFGSSGRGKRENFRVPPLPRQNIISLTEGNKTEDEIISEIQNGILIDDINSGELNYSTLETTMFVKESFLIKNGKKSHPLKSFSIKMGVSDIIAKIGNISDTVYIGGWEGGCRKNGQLIRNGYKIPSFVISKIKF